MKSRLRILATSLIAVISCLGAAIPSNAQVSTGSSPTTAKWVGVWQGELEGFPGVVLTLGDDLGDLSGTIVFTAIRDGAVAGHATHVILHPHLDGNGFSFQVKRPGHENDILDMTLNLSGERKGQLVCAKCDAAPSIAMEKIP
jgi:hypothetical protein